MGIIIGVALLIAVIAGIVYCWLKKHWRKGARDTVSVSNHNCRGANVTVLHQSRTMAFTTGEGVVKKIICLEMRWKLKYDYFYPFIFACFFVLFIWFFSFQVLRHLIRYFPHTIWLLINSFRLLIVPMFRRRRNILRPLIRTPRPLIQQRTQHNEALFTALGATIIWSVVQTLATDRPLCPRRLTSVRLNICVYKLYVYIEYTCT